ncbi:MAG: DNA mismatch endonuclease Vsr [Mesorhizobium sp.]|nr:MAG: DNA mismatch endonuclease Vsr [Mesorhizobium sp.]
MDTRTPEQRRHIMQSVRQKNTGPEIAIRRALHAMGYRFRLHVKELTGKPDIVFPSRRKAIFVHGCFWHGHDCTKGRLPKSREDYWGPKIAANKARDEQTMNKLKELGWDCMAVWQCETKDSERIVDKIKLFLGDESRSRADGVNRLSGGTT